MGGWDGVGPAYHASWTMDGQTDRQTLSKLLLSRFRFQIKFLTQNTYSQYFIHLRPSLFFFAYIIRYTYLCLFHDRLESRIAQFRIIFLLHFLCSACSTPTRTALAPSFNWLWSALVFVLVLGPLVLRNSFRSHSILVLVLLVV